MITTETFRQLALALPNTIELPHFEKTSFRLTIPGKKTTRIFATMDEKNKIAILMFSPIEQSVFCAFNKDIIYPVPNAWGKQGCTVFELGKMKKSMMKDALEVVYREVHKKINKK
jgi:hypothetical protein